MSVSYSELTPFVMTLEEFQEIIALHDETGNLDYVSCGSGNYIDWDRVMPTYPFAEKLGTPEGDQFGVNDKSASPCCPTW